MNQRDLLHTGDIYYPNDPSIMEDQLRWLDRLYDFNNTRPTELGKREKLLRKVKPSLCDFFIPEQAVEGWERMDSELLARFLLPVHNSGSFDAMEVFLSDLKSGEPFYDSLTAFCRQVISYADIPVS